MKRLIFLVFLCLRFAPVHAGCGTLAELSVHDLTDRLELPVYAHSRRCFVAGKPGNEYQIVLRNRAAQDLLAVISVDGINAITGETAVPTQSGYVAESDASVEIRGWRKSLQRVAAFYFTDLGRSYAGRTGRPENVGVIGAALFRRRHPPAPLADLARDAESAKSDESPARGAASPLGTGHGRSVTSSAQYPFFERATEQPEEVIAVYYDSQPNLVARGVIPTATSRRDPLPFPARFTPDPPQRR